MQVFKPLYVHSKLVEPIKPFGPVLKRFHIEVLKIQKRGLEGLS